MKGKLNRLGIAALFLIAFAAFTSLGQDNVAPLGIFPSPPESSELEVRIWVDQAAYQVGEPIVVHYSVNKPAYVYIWDIYPDGTADPLFPNAQPGGSENFVLAGEHTVPGNWEIGPPLGTEHMQILATTSPVDPFAFFSPQDPGAFQAQIEVQILGILPVTERSWDFTSFEIVAEPPSTYGTLVINSTPSGASISVDGQYAGYTPRTLFVTPGFHQIAVSKPGYLGWQAATLIIGGITRSINVTLVPLFPTNASPIADFSYSPANPPVGAWVQFSGSGSSDSDGSIVSYSWNFGDGSTDSGVSQWHRFNSSGTYIVTLTVMDNDGATDTMTQAVQVGSSNQAPVAAFSATPTSPMVNAWVQFDATASADSDGSIVSYAWNFGDGSTDSGSLVWHRFNAAGTYVVTLTVTDDDGASDSTSLAIQVGPSNQSPVATFTFTPTNPLANAWVQFDATPSSDPDGSIVNYAWNFGDGTTDIGSVVWHRFAGVGIYVVTLTVTDNDGATNTSTQTIHVGGGPVNAAPTASFSYLPASPTIGEWVRFDGTGSTDSDGSISSYQWSFGDGTAPVIGPIVYHQFTGAGTYVVSLTVTDDAAASDTSSQSVGVGTLQQAPVALFAFTPAAPAVGESVSFNASTSYDPDGVIVSYRWDLDGNSVDDAFTPAINATYNTPGIAMVRLTVIDNDGLSSTSTQGVVITAAGGTPGVPAMGTTPGIFVWGTDSWHLTVNAAAGWFTPHSYRLELRSDEPFQNIGQSSSGGVVPLGILPTPIDAGRTLVFDGSLQAGSVDYEFRAPNSSSIWMKLELDIDGNGTLDTSSSFVYLRHSMVHPPTSPFVVGLPSGSSDELTPTINFRIGTAISYTETSRFVFWTTTISNLEAP